MTVGRDSMNYSDMFRVEPESKIDLRKIAPDFTDKNMDKESADGEINKHNQRLRELQYLMYAENSRSLLICLQAMDAAGKDGTIRHVLGAMNPQGTKVHSFKAPTGEELSHDFLWRIHLRTPGKGEVAIFNRSHYEDVLVARVHDLVPRKVWKKRYGLINDFEKNLVENGTHILKFFLHISEDEQLRRFKQRLDDPARHWKISDADYTERKLWPEYMDAYEEALSRTSTKHAKWFVIPANHKWYRNLTISRIVVETMESFGMKLPAPKADIEEIRRQYHAASEI
jgi:PPK2 family polyphosphate:nucleotide phosphotransferase